jgi:hypothetical protein
MLVLKDRSISNSLTGALVGLGSALFVTGCANKNRTENGPADDGVDSRQVKQARSPVPPGMTLSEYLDQVGSEPHTQSRGTTFVQSYKQGYMEKDQYALNLVQRHALMNAVLANIRTNPRMVELFGVESFDLLGHLENDLEKLGKPVSSIRNDEVLAPTKECIAYIRKLSPEASLAVAHIFVGGAANGGPRIAQGIQKCLGADTPVSTFASTPHEAVERFDERLNGLRGELHQEVVDAELQMYALLIRINNDPAFENRKK